MVDLFLLLLYKEKVSFEKIPNMAKTLYYVCT